MFEYISLVLSNKLVKMKIKNSNSKKLKKTQIGRGGPDTTNANIMATLRKHGTDWFENN